MNQILSQEEVDALLRGVSGGDVETESDPEPEEGDIALFDLTSQDKVKRDPMPTLDMVQGKFARRMRNTLSAAIQRPVDVNFLTSTFVKLGDYVKTLQLPTSLHILRLEPLRGLAMLVLESRLVYDLIDSFFGGRGQFPPKIEGREFSIIELRMIRKVVQDLLRDIEAAWEAVTPVQVTLEREEFIPQFASIAPPAELVVVAHYEVELDQSSVSGRIALCIPYPMLEPIRDKLRAGFQIEADEADDTWRRRITENVVDTQVDISVELGGSDISIRDLLALAPGDLITLNQDVSSELIIHVEGVPKFLGFAGSLHSNKAVRLTSAFRRR